MKKLSIITLSFLLIINFSYCSRSSVSPEDKVLIAYEKYVDDIIAEYKKIDASDFEAYNNIAPLSEIGTDLKEQIKYTIFNDEQQQKLEKIEEKRKDYFNNR